MEQKKILDLKNDGVNMATDDNYLYIRANRTMYKYQLSNMELTSSNKIFNKDGNARTFDINEKYVGLLDFCDFYLLDIKDLQVLEVMHLGNDLSSDLVTIKLDQNNAYISVRHGKMLIVNLTTRKVSSFTFSNYSSWDHAINDKQLFIADTNGEIVKIDLENSRITMAQVCKKNIYSIYMQMEYIYIISQDRYVKKLKSSDLSIILKVKNDVRGMNRIIGIYKDMLIVSEGVISFWDKNTLKLIEKISFPTGHFNKGVVLSNNILIGSDYNSIYQMTLD